MTALATLLRRPPAVPVLRLVQGAAIACAVAVWWPVIADLAAPSTPADPVRSLGPRSAPSLRSMAARPLFDPARRPGRPPGATVAGAGADLAFDAAYLVRGVVTGPGGEVVIVQHRGTGRSVRLRRDQSLDGYRLESVGSAEVVFARESARVAFPRGVRQDPS